MKKGADKRRTLKDYTSMQVELPEHPEIARVIWPDKQRIYINAAADPHANIDYLMTHGQVFLALSPQGELPEGKPV